MRFLQTSLVFLMTLLVGCKGAKIPASSVEKASVNSKISTQEDRKALFDYIIAKTLEREAFSPVKESKLNYNPIKSMKAYEEEFVNAETEEAFWYALKKLSNARKDRHLSIRAIKAGIKEPEALDKETGIVFYPDFGDTEKTTFFVSDIKKEGFVYGNGDQVQIGDELIEVNGEAIESYIKKAEPYIRYSNYNNFLVYFADRIGTQK